MMDPLDRDTFMRSMDMSEQKEGCSKSAINRFWNWMYSGEEGMVQVCAFPVPTQDQSQKDVGQGKWIHTSSKDEFIDFCDTHSDLWRYHVYAGVNTLNHVPEYGRGDLDHIDRVNHVSLDIETDKDPYTGAGKEQVWYSYKFGMAQAAFIADEWGVYPLVIMSENGIHLHYKADFEVTEDLLVGKQHIYTKYVTHRAMESDYASTIEGRLRGKVQFDQDDVSDPPRVMKVPGTRGIKSESGRMCGIIHEPDPQDAGVLTEDDISVPDEWVNKVEEVTKDEVNKKMVKESNASNLSPDVAQRVKHLAKNDDTFREYWEGEISQYSSRSEVEFAFVLKLLNHDFTKEEVIDIMWASGMTKWAEESDHYRRRTIDTALDNFDGNTVKDSSSGSYSFSRV